MNSNLPSSPDCYVISLLSDNFRRQYITRELARNNISFKFLNAVDGRALSEFPPEYAVRKRHLRYGYDLTPGEIGCFMSHRALWKLCVEQNQPILVLEDDAQIRCNLQDALKEAYSLGHDWEFLRLSGLRKRRNVRLKIRKTDNYDIVEELTDPAGTGGYLVRPKGAKKLLKASEHFFVPVDNFIEHRFQTKLKSIAIVPYPVMPRNFESTILGRADAIKTKKIRLKRLFFRAATDARRFLWIMGRMVHRSVGLGQ